MSTISTDDLQILLTVLRAAGVSRFRDGTLEIDLPTPQAPVSVAQPAESLRQTANPYLRAFGGTLPTFPKGDE